MPKDITTTVYTFDELKDEKAKAAARDWLRECVMSDNWWAQVYEMAKRDGVNITGFDLYRKDDCTLEFTDGAFNVANIIKKEHGATCDTYKAAIAYIEAITALPDTGNDEEESRNAQAGDEIEAAFLKALSRAYFKMLRDEAEDMESDAYLDDCLTGNEYTFTATGKRFG